MTRATPRKHLLLVLLAATAAAANPTPGASPAPGLPAAHGQIAGPVLHFERLALANGLSALLLEDHATPMVGVFAVIRAGARHERPGEDGLSHFLEHLLFNGTDTMTQESLYAAADRNTAYSNATTRGDHTVFQILAPRDRLGDALGLHAAMLFRSTLPAEKYEKERGIVLEEIAKDGADPAHAIDQAFRSYLWEGTALARPVIGSPETLRSIGREAVLAYWKRRYVPGNVTVLVVGDATRAGLEKELARTYGAIPAGVVPPPDEPVRPAIGASPELRTMPGGSRVEVRVGLEGPDPVHPDAAALDTLASLLSEGPGPSLDRTLAADFPTVAAGAWLERNGGATTMILQASAPAGTDPARLSLALREAAAAAPGLLGDADLARVHTRLAVAASFLAEKPHYFGLEKASLLVNAGAGAVEGEGIAWALVNRSALAGVARRWIGGRSFRAVAAGPELEAASRTLAVPAAGAGVNAASTAGPTPVRVNRVLPSGLRLAVTGNPRSSVFAVHVLMRDRTRLEGPAQSGMGELLHRLIARRGEDFARDLAAIGAEVKTHDSPGIPFDDYYDVPEYGYLRLETIDAFSAEALRALATLLSPPTFDDADLARAKTEQQARIQKDAASAQARSASLLARALYGESSPLSRGVRGEAAVVEQATRASLLAFARDYLSPGNLVVTVETGAEPDAMAERIAATLLGLGAPGAAPPPASVAGTPAAPRTPGRSDERLGGSQTYVRIGSPLALKPAERAAATLAAAVLSERLAADIREKRGMAYSIGAGLSIRGGALPDAWSASAGTRPENADEVRAAMLAIVAQLRAVGPREDELSLAAARLEGRELMRHLSSVSRAYSTGLDLWRGDEPGAGVKRIHALGRVSRDEVVRALERHFDPARLSVVLVRGETAEKK